MQTNELVGIWKLEDSAGKQRIELGLVKFKADGTFVQAFQSPSLCSGVLPKRVTRLKGNWKLDDNILERTFREGTFPHPEDALPGGTHKSLVAINSDTLEIAANKFDRSDKKNFVGVFVYKRVNVA